MFDDFFHAGWISDERFLLVFALSTGLIFYIAAGNGLDLLCNAALLAYLNRSILASHIRTADQYVSTLIICCVIVLTVVLTFSLRSRAESSWQGPGQPYLIPCRTTHRRMFPEKHSFSYSYLTVGVPVSYKGSANGMIEIDDGPRSQSGGMFSFATLFFRSWYRVQASDHLQRGSDELSLRGKLDSYLESEGVDPTQFPHAFLVTAARFAGYHFNPVSFWYLYSIEKTLSAMVLEVNNTFDERRPYLVVRDFSAESKTVVSNERPRIRGHRVKDFHVSPFNSRNGHYTVLASDPLGPGMSGCLGIDVTITLNSSKNQPKLVARLFSVGQAIDPAVLRPLSKVTFLGSWFWVGFATLPRIVKEAGILFYRRKMHVWTRPEPLIETLGRHPNSVEASLEICFRKYLEFLVSRSEKPLMVRLYASGLLSETERKFVSPSGMRLSNDDNLELRILTPAFYSRFVQYTDSLDAMTTECNDNKTIWVNRPDLLSSIFCQAGISPKSTTCLDFVFLDLIRRIRQRPPKISSDSGSSDSKCECNLPTDIKDARMSCMEDYVMSCADEKLKRQYKSATIQQLIGDYYFLGYVDYLGPVMNMVRIGIAWTCASSLTQIMRGRHK